jgi:hypothetical protein
MQYKLDLRKIDSWSKRFGEIAYEVQRAVGNLEVCFGKLEDSAEAFL